MPREQATLKLVYDLWDWHSVYWHRPTVTCQKYSFEGTIEASNKPDARKSILQLYKNYFWTLVQNNV